MYHLVDLFLNPICKETIQLNVLTYEWVVYYQQFNTFQELPDCKVEKN